MDEARGAKTRSFFVREAIANYLKALGVTVTDDMIYPPDRTRLEGNHSPESLIGLRINDDDAPVPHQTPVKVNYFPTKKRAKKS